MNRLHRQGRTGQKLGDVAGCRILDLVGVDRSPEKPRDHCSRGIYRHALDLSPDYADAHFNLAGALARSGRSDEAIAHWQRYLELDGGSPWARIARAHLEVMDPPGDPQE